MSTLHVAVGICLLLGSAAADMSWASSSVGGYLTRVQRSSGSAVRSLIPMAPYLLLQPESNATFLGLRIWNFGAPAINASLPAEEVRESQVGYVLFSRKDLHAVQAEAEVSFNYPPPPSPAGHAFTIMLERQMLQLSWPRVAVGVHLAISVCKRIRRRAHATAGGPGMVPYDECDPSTMAARVAWWQDARRDRAASSRRSPTKPWTSPS